MIITVAANKGGVGKTTTAFHLAAYLQQKAKTLLVDGDPNRSSLGWAERGQVPFVVVDERQAAKFARDQSFEHLIIDTEAHPGESDLEALAKGCDLLILPTTPDALSLDALLLTLERLERIGIGSYRILLTMVPPKPSRVGDEARATLERAGLPLFRSSIPRLMAFQNAAARGLPVYQIDDQRSSLAWNAYVALGEELSL